jgi:hypothetical protein
MGQQQRTLCMKIYLRFCAEVTVWGILTLGIPRKFTKDKGQILANAPE